MFVRWESQNIEQDAQGRLPGYADTVVRHFDAPEALDMRFHEVRTKSALNRVPSGSRVPFEWTVNPYRGCSHACSYCAHGDTRILMGDGMHRALADLRKGDEIYGTERRGPSRRLIRTQVLAHWSTVKPAYRVTLADGTELVASGDHRFLSERGWKHVTGAEPGRTGRPHLGLDHALVGTGRFAAQPARTEPYRRGYLCGTLRGDACGEAPALERTGDLLVRPVVPTREREPAVASVTARDMRAVGASHDVSVEPVSELAGWPWSPGDDWPKGFLAGVLDAEGSCDGGLVTRIRTTDPEVVAWTRSCLDRLGFDAVVEPATRAAGLAVVRVRGGVREQLRLFHMTGAATTCTVRLDGLAIEANAELRVISIEPVGTLRLYDITTGTGDFIANGVVSHNCFARPTHEYLELDAGRDFEREIVVKVNVPEVLRAELARPSWGGGHVALGTNTDPYQWVEGRYQLMRGIWEAMRDAANPCSILTKSPLVLRDLDLLKEIAERTQVSACLSVPTLDEKAWRTTEPHTPHPRARLEAVAELNRAGIPTGILIAPLMPGINDAPEQVERIVQLATEAGAVHIAGNTLFLRGSVREIFFAWLAEHRPDLLPRYEALYAKGAYVPVDERRTIERAAGAPWARTSYPDRFKHRTAGERRRMEAPRRAGGPPAAPEQGVLF